MALRIGGSTRRDRATTPAVPFISAVSSSGRYFVDQAGSPILVKGDSPWGAPTKMSTAEWTTYCEDRAGRGFNASLVSLIGSGIIGSNDNGATYDGVLPFTGGNVTTPNATYWARMDTFLDIAEANGITVFAYPIDGWTVLGGRVFDGVSSGNCQTFGAFLANRWAGRPNIVWMFGGDYDGGTTPDGQMGGCLAGIRSTGDTRLASCQMIYQRTWTGQYTYWKSRSDFWHVYSYPVQYDAVYAAYNDAGDETPKVPALFMEGHYGGENDGANALTIRKQAAWAMTQGSPGHFYGSDDWDLFSGWAGRLGSYSVADVSRIHSAVGSVAWWKLAPSRTFLTSGAGTLVNASAVGQTSDSSKDPSNSTYATAAVAADGTLALVYLPTQRAIQVNLAELGSSPTGTWISTATLAESAAGSLASTVTPPSSGDWLLRITAT